MSFMQIKSIHKPSAFQEYTFIKINIGTAAGELGWALASLLCPGASRPPAQPRGVQGSAAVGRGAGWRCWLSEKWGREPPLQLLSSGEGSLVIVL